MSLFKNITPERRAELRRMRKEQDMKHETEKLAEALAIENISDDTNAYKMTMRLKFLKEHGEGTRDVINQAARRYAEVLPYIDTLLKIDMSSGDREKAALSVIAVKANIAAIVARDEERKQSDE